MRVYSRETSDNRWSLIEEYLPCMGATIYVNRFSAFVDMPFATNNSLFELGGQSRSEVIVCDSNGSTVRMYLLNFPPPDYLSNETHFLPQALMWVVIITASVAIATLGAGLYCYHVAETTRVEVSKWEDEIRYEHGAGADKLVHCVAACLINLRAGRLCALLAARSTERGGNPFGPLAPGGDLQDEKAAIDGVDCGDSIKGCGSVIQACIKPPWGTGNDWLDCQSCCRQKGHKGVIKWH